MVGGKKGHAACNTVAEVKVLRPLREKNGGWGKQWNAACKTVAEVKVLIPPQEINCGWGKQGHAAYIAAKNLNNGSLILWS